jgi:chorismate mutase
MIKTKNIVCVPIIAFLVAVMFPPSTTSLHCHAFASGKTYYPWNSNLVSSAKRNRLQSPTTPSKSAMFSSSSAAVNGEVQNVSNNHKQINTTDNTQHARKEDEDDGIDGNYNVKLTTSEVLSLDSIRASLIRQEETIIFALIERAQFRQNLKVYQPGALISPGNGDGEDQQQSFLQYMMMGTEALHATVRRYMSPEEHPFYPDRLPTSKQGRVLEDLEFPTLLSDLNGAASENFNPILLKKYVEWVVPSICEPGDDEQHGSTALCDVALLQALSKRIHYGKFVAESKFLSDPNEYERLVDTNDADGVMKLLTNEVVEAKVLRRARLKAATYGHEPLLAELPPLPNTVNGDNKEMTSIVAAAAASAVVAAIEAMGSSSSSTGSKVCPATVESIYRDLIIPLTKDVEVAYLFRRCGREPPPEYAPDRMSVDCTKSK